MTNIKVIKILKILIPIIFLIVFSILCVSISKKNKEIKRIKENYEIIVNNNEARQQSITLSELKDYFSEEVNTLKEYNIRPKDVQNIIEYHYVFIDSIVYRDTLVYIYDTVRNVSTSEFCVNGNNWTVAGKIICDTIEIENVEINDDFIVTLYKERKKCIFDKRRISAIVVSKYSGKQKIYNNLLVE